MKGSSPIERPTHEDRAARVERSVDVAIVGPDRRVSRHQARRGPGRLRLRQRSVDQRRPELQLVPSPRIVGDGADEFDGFAVFLQVVPKGTRPQRRSVERLLRF